ncbi:MAG: hypothetical protein KJ709_07430 [Nanoarchaeota archaeon]|nr:hypothetical protein [Nanoarchaeota archaeon]
MKKAQASGAAALIALIALFVLLYILFLPAELREDLLGEPTLDGDDNDDNSGEVRINRTLVKESPGLLDEMAFKEYDHIMSTVTLYTTTSASVLKQANSLYIKNGVFDRQDSTLTFRIDDLDVLENVMLSFIAKRHSGTLKVSLNGHLIYESKLEQQNVEPIVLEKEYMANDNDLVFSVSSVGWAFWKTNEYELQTVQVTSDVSDISGQESKNIFLVSTTEKHNLDKAKIRFVPECSGTVGRLRVYVNNNNVFDSVPDCGSPVLQEFSPGYLEAGENRVVFRGEGGRFIIDQIMVHTDLKELAFPTYFFDLSDDEFRDIEKNEKTVNMTLRFIEDEELKKADIYTNGRRTQLYTHDLTWSRNLDNSLEEGSNGIKIEPDGTLEAVELRVILYDIE